MKRFLLLYLFAILLFPTMTLHAQSQLVVEQTDGGRTVFVLTDRPVITFGEGNLLVRSQIAEVQFAQSEVSKFYFEAVNTGIYFDAKEHTTSFDLQNENILVAKGIEGVIRLYDTTGHCHLAVVAQKNEAVRIDLSTLSSGCYLVKTPQHPTIKILKK